jgi:hypothetical protein
MDTMKTAIALAVLLGEPGAYGGSDVFKPNGWAMRGPSQTGNVIDDI